MLAAERQFVIGNGISLISISGVLSNRPERDSLRLSLGKGRPVRKIAAALAMVTMCVGQQGGRRNHTIASSRLKSLSRWDTFSHLMGNGE